MRSVERPPGHARAARPRRAPPRSAAPTRRCRESARTRGRARRVRMDVDQRSSRPRRRDRREARGLDVTEPRADDEQRVRLAEPRRERRVLSEPEVACVAPRLVVDVVLTAPCCRDGDGARLEPLPETFVLRRPSTAAHRRSRAAAPPPRAAGGAPRARARRGACAAAYGDASATSARSTSMSSGTASTTGPGRPDVAVRKARATSSGSRSASSTCATHFVSEPNTCT